MIQWALLINLTPTSLVVFSNTFAILVVRTFFVSFQLFSLLLLYGMFLNINVLCKLQFLKSSIASKSLLISLSWSANFLSCSVNLKFKFSILSLYFVSIFSCFISLIFYHSDCILEICLNCIKFIFYCIEFYFSSF